MWPSGAARDGVGAVVGSFDSEPAYAEFASAAQPLLPTFGEVVGDYFQHLAGKSQHLFSC